MITKEFYKSIGLTDEQTAAISKALEREQRYRDILRRAGVMPQAIERIVATSDTETIDEIGEAALIEMIKEEWSGFITSKNKPERRF
jgi:hypothetical protein